MLNWSVDRHDPLPALARPDPVAPSPLRPARSVRLPGPSANCPHVGTERSFLAQTTMSVSYKQSVVPLCCRPADGS